MFLNENISSFRSLEKEAQIFLIRAKLLRLSGMKPLPNSKAESTKKKMTMKTSLTKPHLKKTMMPIWSMATIGKISSLTKMMKYLSLDRMIFRTYSILMKVSLAFFKTVLVF